MSQITNNSYAVVLPVKKIIPNLGDDVTPNVSGELNLAGGNLIATTGNDATNTITFDVTGGTDGQVILASTAGNPTFATLTSAGGTVTFTPGANSLNLEAGASVPISFLTDDANSAVPALGVLTVTGGANLISSSAGSTVTLELNDGLRITTGFESWGGAGPYFDDTTLGDFTVLRPGTGYIDSAPITWAAPQTVTGMVAGKNYWIFVDNTGTVDLTDTYSEALYKDNIVLFECLRDSTPVTNNQTTIKENHPFEFPVATSVYLHDTVGTIIENAGANIVLNGTQKIQINGDDQLSDHGLYTDITDSAGVGVTWHKMYTDGAGKWATHTDTDTFTGTWNDAGTPTALAAGKFGAYRLYVAKDNLNTATPKYFAILNTAEYNNLTLANAAISAGTISLVTYELEALELAQLGYIIYSESANAIVSVIIAKSTLRSTITTSGTNTAALVIVSTTDFDGILSAGDTNVQQALETIDEFGKNLTDHCVVVGNGNGNPLGVIGAGTTGTLLVGATGADPAFATIAYGDFTFSNLTAATPTTLSVSNGDGDPASDALLLLGVGAGAGDAYVNWQISATTNYAAGIDNSVAGDPWILSNSSDPSSGDALLTVTNAGVVYLHNALDVTEGGTGVNAFVAYTPVCGGTTAGGDLQSVAAVGNAGEVLTSNGAAALPTFQAVGGGGLVWSAATGDMTIVVDNGYITKHATPATKLEYTLPAAAVVGKVFRIAGYTAGGWKIVQGADQQIFFGDQATTLGAGGYLEFTNQYDSLECVCVSADLEWLVVSSVGNITVV